MSFRIEDILKDKPKCAKNTETDNSTILQETLINYPPSLGRFGDFNRLFGNTEPSTTCYSFNNYSGYLDNGHPILSTYNPQNIWPLYARSFHPGLPFYQHCNKRKGGQVRFTSSQTDALEKRFKTHKYLSPEDRKHLADALKLSDRQVKTWFQNRRAKWRRCNNISSSSERIQCDSDIEEEVDKIRLK